MTASQMLKLLPLHGNFFIIINIYCKVIIGRFGQHYQLLKQVLTINISYKEINFLGAPRIEPGDAG